MRDVYPYSREAIWLYSNQRLSYHGLSIHLAVTTWPSELGHHNMAITTCLQILAIIATYIYLAIEIWLSDGPSLHQIYTWPSQLGHHITYSKSKAISAARHSAPVPQYPLDLLDGFRRSCPIFLVFLVFGFLTVISIFFFSCSGTVFLDPFPRPYWHAFPGFLPGCCPCCPLLRRCCHLGGHYANVLSPLSHPFFLPVPPRHLCCSTGGLLSWPSFSFFSVLSLRYPSLIYRQTRIQPT